MRANRRSFSMVELLVVTTVLFILASILAPTLNRVFHNAQTTECKTHLKSIHQAIVVYVDDQDGYLPGPCEGNARPYYYREIKYNKFGDLFRRNQKMASHIRDYMNPQKLDDTYDYNPEFICPTSAEIVELGQDARLRAHYKVLNPSGIKRPFGIWKRRDSAGVVQPMEPSKRLVEIQNPSEAAALKDSLDTNKTMSSVSDYPVHPEFLENHIYFDGRIESIQNLSF